MRRIASAVAVLTTRTNRGPHGVTVSSLSALSREPLLVGICLQRQSASLALLKESRTFAVSVLTASQAEPARRFADPQRPRGRAQFDLVDWEPDPYSGAPLIADALSWLSCRLVTTAAAGDHELLLAEVVEGVARDGHPLLNFGGAMAAVTTLEAAAPPAHRATPDLSTVAVDTPLTRCEGESG
ncbi:flavin reductase family protein [Salinispora cortesiana]|uniref:flavin reductase family protein n=1 Tax=Salinispora cortesiana TaxID=1305843 RepID=UPI0024812DB5|nr:flavin reductase family protein [Salinispora cortesiana]